MILWHLNSHVSNRTSDLLRLVFSLSPVQDLTSHFKSSRPSSHTKWRFREGFSGKDTFIIIVCQAHLRCCETSLKIHEIHRGVTICILNIVREANPDCKIMQNIMSDWAEQDHCVKLISGKIWALRYDNGEEVALLYTEKDTVR